MSIYFKKKTHGSIALHRCFYFLIMLFVMSIYFKKKIDDSIALHRLFTFSFSNNIDYKINLYLKINTIRYDLYYFLYIYIKKLQPFTLILYKSISSKTNVHNLSTSVRSIFANS